MKYLVMECHPGYAVVLDDAGRFLQVANRNFEVGQQLSTVVELRPVRQKKPVLVLLRTLGTLAACLAIVALCTWQLLLPYGTVRMKINPDVKLTVNRFDYVLEITPLNPDAQALLAGYQLGTQKVDQVTDSLAHRAYEMGYLADDGQIQLSVESTHLEWLTATRDRLIAELDAHIGHITAVPNTDPIPEFGDWDDDDDGDDIDDDDSDEDDDIDEDDIDDSDDITDDDDSDEDDDEDDNDSDEDDDDDTDDEDDDDEDDD